MNAKRTGCRMFNTLNRAVPEPEEKWSASLAASLNLMGDVAETSAPSGYRARKSSKEGRSTPRQATDTHAAASSMCVVFTFSVMLGWRSKAALWTLKSSNGLCGGRGVVANKAATSAARARTVP